MGYSLADVRKLRNAEPFRPFTVHLRDGRRFHVDRPEYCGYHPEGTKVGVAADADSIEVFDVAEIADLKPDDRRTAATQDQAA